MRILLFTLMSMACAVAVPATVYKWVDENGVVHYHADRYQMQPDGTLRKWDVAAGQYSVFASGVRSFWLLNNGQMLVHLKNGQLFRGDAVNG